MASVIKAGNATDGVQVTSDNTGILELKTGTGAGTTAMTVGTGQNVTFSQSANLPNTFGFKNRIINGAMVIDQRNAGAAVTANAATNPYITDRWRSLAVSGSGQFSAQQSTVAPPGFTNSLLFTSLAATSVGASDAFGFRQPIEGFNCSDLGFGTASASSVTLSFWVRSSLTGTFGGSVANNSANRSYPFSYTISAANTWEQKTVTVPGDTTGTWATDNTTGINVWFGLGVGSTRSGTAGAWAASDFRSTTSAVQLVATNGATFYITGVQLEKGSTATSFDYRDYGRELILCQRYFEKSYNDGTAIGAVTVVGVVGQSGLQGVTSTTEAGIYVTFKVTKRATPTIAVWDGNGNSNKVDRIQAGVTNNYNSTFSGTSNLGGNGFVGYSASGAACTSIQFHYTASSEL